MSKTRKDLFNRRVSSCMWPLFRIGSCPLLEGQKLYNQSDLFSEKHSTTFAWNNDISLYQPKSNGKQHTVNMTSPFNACWQRMRTLSLSLPLPLPPHPYIFIDFFFFSLSFYFFLFFSLFFSLSLSLSRTECSCIHQLYML